METNIPMGRPGTGDDVASTIVFLYSEEGHLISGQSINVVGEGSIRDVGVSSANPAYARIPRMEGSYGWTVQTVMRVHPETKPIISNDFVT